MDYDKLLKEMQQRRSEGLGKTSIAGFVLADIDQLVQAVRELRSERKILFVTSARAEGKTLELQRHLKARDILIENTPSLAKLQELEQQNAGLRDRNGLYVMEVRQLRAALERAKEALTKVIAREGEEIYGDVVCVDRESYTVCRQALAAIEGKK